MHTLADMAACRAARLPGQLPTGAMPPPAPCRPVRQVDYESMPGWKSDISKARKWSDLPQAAKNYIQRIEDHIGIYVKWIGVGPGRDALVEKPAMGKCP